MNAWLAASQNSSLSSRVARTIYEQLKTHLQFCLEQTALTSLYNIDTIRQAVLNEAVHKEISWKKHRWSM